MCLKNAEVGVNFGGQPLKHASSLPPNFKPLASAPPAQLSVAAAAPGAGGGGKGAGGSGGGGGGSGGRTPMALVLEPTKDLAEQTHETFVWMSEHLASPKLQPLLLIGGDRDASAAKQARALQGDVDVVTGTPLRVLDFVETGKLDLSRVRFFVLDEADRLLVRRLASISRVARSHLLHPSAVCLHARRAAQQLTWSCAPHLILPPPARTRATRRRS